MSGYLWTFYLEDDVDSFRRLLQTANYTTRPGTQKNHGPGQHVGGGAIGLGYGSPTSFGTSPTLTIKGRKDDRLAANSTVLTLTRTDINHRDAFGRTLLHLAASSSSDKATEFAAALLEHPLTDIYLQDFENGWTALHRAFYAGNIIIAQSILARDTQDALGHGSGALHHNTGSLIKMKDREGNGPFDLFEMSLEEDNLAGAIRVAPGQASDSDDEEMPNHINEPGKTRNSVVSFTNLEGDEVYTFGSNKNVTLGFGDEDDRQYPERIILKRPDHLYFRFFQELMDAKAHLQNLGASVSDLTKSSTLPQSISEFPAIIRNKPIVIQNMQMSKLHSAIITCDPESNLYVCGHGSGGRLGLGDETTRYQFVCVDGAALSQRRVIAIALGQDHTLALSDEGDLFTWGSNGYGQLGYELPKTRNRKEELVQTSPRQVFGPLKREIIVGVAASRIHSIVHSNSSLYTFGKNEGQLGLVDSDARSLEIQDVPRRVGAALFSARISSVSAIDRATTCLLENGEVWVFANYGYTRLTFPLDGFTNYFLRASFRTTKYESSPNSISKIVSKGDTICAMSTGGEIFTVAVSQPSMTTQTKSTTNPSKIKGALSQPLRIWSNKKSHMAARDVNLDQNGSIIIATVAGSVWRRIKRAKIKDATASGTGEYKPKDYKFSRISGLTRVIAVRASGFGAYAAVREDCKKTRSEMGVSAPTLWTDLWPLLPFQSPYPSETDAPSILRKDLIEFIMTSHDSDNGVDKILRPSDACVVPYDLVICSTTSSIMIPLHQFIFTARSPVIRQALDELNESESAIISEVLSCRRDGDGMLRIIFEGADILTLFNLILFLYSDTLVAFWNLKGSNKRMASRHRATRTELLKIATKLELTSLESGLKRMISTNLSLDKDMEKSFQDPAFFDNSDIAVQLADGEEAWVHGALICQRCPFFQGLFKGRAGGKWLADRREMLSGSNDVVRVNLKHVKSSTFQLVLRHLYADTGPELFDDIVADDVDSFLDVVIDVLGVANELMLDRLSEVCQKVIGLHVTVRTVCPLIAAIAPSSVTSFKTKCLEYICYNLESVLQHGHLDELDEDLLAELDATAQALQRNCSIFARTGRAEEQLFENHPELRGRIEQERRSKIESIVLVNKYSDVESRAASSYRAGSFHERFEYTEQAKQRRKSMKDNVTSSSSPVSSPALGSQRFTTDLMFEMDDEDDGDEDDKASPLPISLSERPKDAVKSQITEETANAVQSSPSQVYREDQSLSSHSNRAEVVSPGSPLAEPWAFPSTPSRVWGAAPLLSTKLGIEEIMAQASSSRTSNISLGLPGVQSTERKTSGSFKPSQKERKRLQVQQQQQQQQQERTSTPAVFPATVPSPISASPWKLPSLKRKPATSSSSSTDVPASPSTPHLTMRQTVANPINNSNTDQRGQTSSSRHDQTRKVSLAKPQSSPGSGRPSKQNPSSSDEVGTPKTNPIETPGFSISNKPVPIQSVRHTPRPCAVSSSLGLGLEEILSEQLIEKTVIKDFASKRSLQEIQQEQEFQEWWEKESARFRDEDLPVKTGPRDASSSSRGRTRRRGRGGHARGHGRSTDSNRVTGDKRSTSANTNVM